MNNLIMIKYGELTTKKANRKLLINTLTQNIEKMLSNEGFINKAPQEKVEEEKKKLENYKEMLKTVEERLKTLK